MYLWNYKKLATEFVKGNLTEKDKLLYVLVPTAFTFVGLMLHFVLFSRGVKTESSDLLIGYAKLIVPMIETFFMLIVMLTVYKINSKADDKDLISRYFAFKFIAIIKTAVFMLMISMLFGIKKALYINHSIIKIDSIEFMMISMLSVFYSCYVQIKSFVYLKHIYLNEGTQPLKTTKKKIILAKKDSKKKVAKNTQIKRR